MVAKISPLTIAIDERFDSLTSFQGFEPAGQHGPGIGWVNPVTGHGTARDKTVAGRYQGYIPTDLITLSSLYHGDDLAARIIDAPCEEMLRLPFAVKTGDEEADEWLAEEFERLEVREKLLEGLRWGRLFGGAWVLLGADDGQAADMPLAVERADSLDWLRVVDRRFMWPISYYDHGAKMGTPDRFVVSQTYAGVAQGAYTIHESRMIRFHGAPTGLREKNLNASYDYSVLDRAWPQLRLFATLWKGVEILITEGPQGVYKVANLAKKLEAGQKELVRQRFAVADYYRSVFRAVIIDKDEEFERQAMALSGVPEILNQATFRICATAEIPSMVLFGQDPSGLNANGSASLRWWQDKCASKQRNDLAPKIRHIARAMLLTKGAKDLARKVKVEFEPLYTLTALEEAQAFQAEASGCSALVSSQILTPEEVALSKVRNGEWASGWEGVRQDEREKMLEDLLKKHLEGMAEGGEIQGELPPEKAQDLQEKDGGNRS